MNMLRAVKVSRVSSIVLASTALSMLVSWTNASANTDVTPTTITKINIYSGKVANGAQIFVSPAIPQAEGCSYAPGDLLWIDFSSTAQPDGRALWATVLAAVAAGKKLSFGISGCAMNGQVPLVYSVSIVP